MQAPAEFRLYLTQGTLCSGPALRAAQPRPLRRPGPALRAAQAPPSALLRPRLPRRAAPARARPTLPRNARFCPATGWKPGRSHGYDGRVYGY